MTGLEVIRALGLGVHVVAGGGALLLAAALLLGPDRWAGRTGRWYGAAVLTTAATAVLLAGPGSGLPGPVRLVLVAVAVASAAAAQVGLHRLRAGVDGAGRLLHGSVVSLVTAVAVVSTPPAGWVAVVLGGTLWVELNSRRGAARPVVRA